MENNLKSKCCGADYYSHHLVFYCEKCGKPCEIQPAKPINKFEEILQEFRNKFGAELWLGADRLLIEDFIRKTYTSAIQSALEVAENSKEIDVKDGMAYTNRKNGYIDEIKANIEKLLKI